MQKQQVSRAVTQQHKEDSSEPICIATPKMCSEKKNQTNTKHFSDIQCYSETTIVFILPAWQASVQVIAPGVARLIKKFKHRSTYQQTSGVAETTAQLYSSTFLAFSASSQISIKTILGASRLIGSSISKNSGRGQQGKMVMMKIASENLLS